MRILQVGIAFCLISRRPPFISTNWQAHFYIFVSGKVNKREGTTLDSHSIHQLFDQHSLTMSWQWRNTQGWPLIQCSQSCLTILGITEAQIRAGEVLLVELIHPEDLVNVIRNSQQDVGAQFDNQYRVKTASGDWRWVKDERCFRADSSFDGSDCISVVHDVSSEHRVFMDLQKTKERLELVFEGTRVGVWEYLPKDNITLLDKTWSDMLGLEFDKLKQVQSTWESLVHPDDLGRVKASVEEHFDGKTPYYEELVRLKHADGHWMHILDRARVVSRNEDGEVERFIGTHTDVSELVKARQKAEQALDSRDRFFSAISHELRTPLHAILGMTEILLPEIENQQHKKKLKIIDDSSTYLLTLIKDILDISKIEEGKMAIHPSVVDLQGIVEKSYSLFNSRAMQKGLSMSLSIPDGLSTAVQSDSARLMQVIANLISNAIKYTEVGEITISIFERDEALVVAIADTGIGISNVEVAFQPYIQEHKGPIDDEHSTGLGLSIVQSLCQLMDIELTVASILQQGSTFELIFDKAMRCEVIKSVIDETMSAEPASWPDVNVLVVDDNEINRIVAKAMLNVPNVHYYEAADGFEALDVLAEKPIDIVFMDLHMPRKGGLRTTFDIRSNPKFKELAIIGLSADAFEQAENKCRAAGMNDFVTKPFKRNTLLSKIEKWVLSTK